MDAREERERERKGRMEGFGVEVEVEDEDEVEVEVEVEVEGLLEVMWLCVWLWCARYDSRPLLKAKEPSGRAESERRRREGGKEGVVWRVEFGDLDCAGLMASVSCSSFWGFLVSVVAIGS